MILYGGSHTRVDLVFRMPSFLDYQLPLKQLEQRESAASGEARGGGGRGSAKGEAAKEELRLCRKEIDKLTKELFVEKSRRRHNTTSFLESHSGKAHSPHATVTSAPEYQRLQQHCSQAEGRAASVEQDNARLRQTIAELSEQLSGRVEEMEQTQQSLDMDS